MFCVVCEPSTFIVLQAIAICDRDTYSIRRPAAVGRSKRRGPPLDARRHRCNQFAAPPGGGRPEGFRVGRRRHLLLETDMKTVDFPIVLRSGPLLRRYVRRTRPNGLTEDERSRASAPAPAARAAAICQIELKLNADLPSRRRLPPRRSRVALLVCCNRNYKSDVV
ncbi:hypothetical protein EVAR_37597_1 [Eumeta japonica]|uniref:Uncharacterized protein n=1 Tax=Eumeta variegata TaxID=151549 RepID=A0A4C1VM86_EUMVA|nr:hypothetical protein EVAR_37597_1 [Eumeta japonica]